jgi:hypothetical protein
MRAKDTFSQTQLRLQAAGCRYRIKQAPRSPYIQVYDTLPPRRQQAACAAEGPRARRPGWARPVLGRTGKRQGRRPDETTSDLGQDLRHGPELDRTWWTQGTGSQSLHMLPAQ